MMQGSNLHQEIEFNKPEVQVLTISFVIEIVFSDGLLKQICSVLPPSQNYLAIFSLRKDHFTNLRDLIMYLNEKQ